ncbi:hypothetical protein KA012_03060 [Candidatus Woesebacteria bacterium]|nr:hypothetical protein [Candidatus Woesebacteria bacterium]
MSDVPQDPMTTPAAPATPAKDPLAVLEELLAKQKQGGAAAPAAVNPEAAAKELELAQKQAEYERLKAEASARDAQLLAEQEQKMQEIAASPEYQARVNQNKTVADEKQQSSDDRQGFEIFQLSTTRVPVPTDDKK